MEISVKGKHLDVGVALRGYVEDHLQNTVAKYFNRAVDGTVMISREGRMFRVDISVHAGRGMVMQGGSAADEAYAAFDGALGHIAKRLRRYKRRLCNHHKVRSPEETLAAQQYIIAVESDDDDEEEEEEVPENAQPAIIAEMAHEIATLTVGEAVMRMDLADVPVMMFRNRAHGGLNLVYRRDDGNVGWIDPSGSKQV